MFWRCSQQNASKNRIRTTGTPPGNHRNSSGTRTAPKPDTTPTVGVLVLAPMVSQKLLAQTLVEPGCLTGCVVRGCNLGKSGKVLGKHTSSRLGLCVLRVAGVSRQKIRAGSVAIGVHRLLHILTMQVSRSIVQMTYRPRLTCSTSL